MKFSIKGFFSKYDQIRRKLRIWSHLLKKSLMENFIFCGVHHLYMVHVSIHLLTTLSIAAVARRCSVKKVFLQISQNSQEKPVPESLF